MKDNTDRYCYDYPMPAITVDAVIQVTANRGKNRNVVIGILTIERKGEPEAGKRALPGGYMEIGETALQAVQREVEEETGLKIPSTHWTQLKIRDAVDRDPRGRIISVPFMTTISFDEFKKSRAGDDATNLRLQCIEDFCSEAAFDHGCIIVDAMGL